MSAEKLATGSATAFPGYTTDELRKRADDLAFQMHLAISPTTFHAERTLVEQMRSEIERRAAGIDKEPRS